MERYKNKRVLLRSRGKFRKAVAADVGIGGVCPVCRHFLLQHYDGDPKDPYPDPRLFRYRCFTCEPLSPGRVEMPDELIEQAKEASRKVGYVSVSHIQRALRIGYTRAASLVDKLQADAFCGKEPSGSRFVLGGITQGDVSDAG
jgi:DNA segregation ATPase FtsK/SpoIIIE-like protein